MNMTFQKKTIGILGGMGPEASAYFYHLLIERAHKKYGAVQDGDFPPVIIYNLPLSGFDERGIVDTDAVLAQLIAGLQKLEHSGCDYIVIACNTVHVFYEELQRAVGVPIINIVSETVSEVSSCGHTKVGIISSQTTRDAGLYKKALEAQHIEVFCVDDTQQEKLNEVILHVMAGTAGNEDADTLKSAMNTLITKGARAIVLGCTELPLAIRQSDVRIPLFNANEIVLDVALACSYGTSKKGCFINNHKSA